MKGLITLKLRILESQHSLSDIAKEVFDKISKSLKEIGFSADIDSYDFVSFLDILNISASNDQDEFISMQIMITRNDEFSVTFKHSLKYGKKKRFISVDDMTDYIIKVVSESDVRTSYDTKIIKQRKQLLCQDCIDSLRGISSKRVTVLKNQDIPKRRIFEEDDEEVCKCDRCKNVYPVDWIHVCTIN